MREWLVDLVGEEMAPMASWALAAAIVLTLVVVVIWVAKIALGSTAGPRAKGRGPRLAVMDVASIDTKRKLVLVRRDEVEHLLLIGGQNDLVVEPHILRVQSGAGRTQRTDPVLRPEPDIPALSTERAAPQIAVTGPGPISPPPARVPQPQIQSQVQPQRMVAAGAARATEPRTAASPLTRPLPLAPALTVPEVPPAPVSAAAAAGPFQARKAEPADAPGGAATVPRPSENPSERTAPVVLPDRSARIEAPREDLGASRRPDPAVTVAPASGPGESTPAPSAIPQQPGQGAAADNVANKERMAQDEGARAPNAAPTVPAPGPRGAPPIAPIAAPPVRGEEKARQPDVRRPPLSSILGFGPPSVDAPSQNGQIDESSAPVITLSAEPSPRPAAPSQPTAPTTALPVRLPQAAETDPVRRPLETPPIVPAAPSRPGSPPSPPSMATQFLPGPPPASPAGGGAGLPERATPAAASDGSPPPSAGGDDGKTVPLGPMPTLPLIAGPGGGTAGARSLPGLSLPAGAVPSAPTGAPRREAPPMSPIIAAAEKQKEALRARTPLSTPLPKFEPTPQVSASGQVFASGQVSASGKASSRTAETEAEDEPSDKGPLSVRSFATSIQSMKPSYEPPVPVPPVAPLRAPAPAAPTVPAAPMVAPPAPAGKATPVTAAAGASSSDVGSSIEDFLSAELDSNFGNVDWDDDGTLDATPDAQTSAGPAKDAPEITVDRPAEPRVLTLEEEMERLLGDFDFEVSDRKAK